MVGRPEPFSVIEGDFDGYPMVAMIREKLEDQRANTHAPWFFGFSTRLSQTTPTGLPTTGEAVDLNQWEDMIEQTINAQSAYIFVGRVTWKGNRELLYYVERPGPIVHEIQKLREARAVRPFAFRYEEDPEWRSVAIYLK